MASKTFKWLSCSTNSYPPKRHKVPKACNTCRLKKMRCDGKHPCNRCQQNTVECLYDDSRRPSAPRKRRASSFEDAKPRNTRLPLSTSVSDDSETEDMCSSTTETVRGEFYIPHLRHIRFCGNDLYQALLKNSSTPRPYHYNHVPPLLLDFFNITSQPTSVWHDFLRLFEALLKHKSDANARKLATETLRLFYTRNPLYHALMKPPSHDLVKFLLPIFTNETPPSYASMHAKKYLDICLLRAMFALIFICAHQCAHPRSTDVDRYLQVYATLFFQEARHGFLHAAFPEASSAQDRPTLLRLTQTSVMLIHFQCMTLCEEQAFMTCMMAVGFSQRCLTPAHRLSNPNLALLRAVEGWAVWLSFYMRRPDAMPRLSISQRAFTSANAQATWAVRTLERYTQFIQSLFHATATKKYVSMEVIKNRLGALQEESKGETVEAISDDEVNDPLDDDDGDDVHDTNYILGADGEAVLDAGQQDDSLATRKLVMRLYHSILVIHLFGCQLERSLFLSEEDAPTSSHSVCQCETEDGMCGHRMALDICMKAATDLALVISTVGWKQRTSSTPCGILAQTFYSFSLSLSVLSRHQSNTSRRTSESALKRVKSNEDLDPTSNSAMTAVKRLQQNLEHFDLDKEMMQPLADRIKHIFDTQGQDIRNVPTTSAEVLRWETDMLALEDVETTAQARTINQTSPGPPSTPDVMSRSVVDREQLEKLSYTAKHRAPASSAVVHTQRPTATKMTTSELTDQHELEQAEEIQLQQFHDQQLQMQQQQQQEHLHHQVQMQAMQHVPVRQNSVPDYNYALFQQSLQDSSASTATVSSINKRMNSFPVMRQQTPHQFQVMQQGPGFLTPEDIRNHSYLSSMYMATLQDPSTSSAHNNPMGHLVTAAETMAPNYAYTIHPSPASSATVPKLPPPQAKPKRTPQKRWAERPGTDDYDWNARFQPSVRETLNQNHPPTSQQAGFNGMIALPVDSLVASPYTNVIYYNTQPADNVISPTTTIAHHPQALPHALTSPTNWMNTQTQTQYIDLIDPQQDTGAISPSAASTTPRTLEGASADEDPWIQMTQTPGKMMREEMSWAS